MGKIQDEIAAENKARNRRTRVEQICESLSNEDKADFLEALNNPNVAASAIIRVMARHDMPISDSAIRLYRQTHNVA